MFTKKLKLMTFLSVVLITAACSNKTKQATSESTSNNQTRNQQRGQQKAGTPPSFQELLTKMDANKDGKLAQSELEGPLKNDFSKIDKNGDGYISEDELKNAPRPQRRSRN